MKTKVWVQFDCLNCMVLESKFWLWKKDATVTFTILVANTPRLIDFGKMVAVATDALGNVTSVLIKRTETNVRQRPNSE